MVNKALALSPLTVTTIKYVNGSNAGIRIRVRSSPRGSVAGRGDGITSTPEIVIDVTWALCGSPYPKIVTLVPGTPCEGSIISTGIEGGGGVGVGVGIGVGVGGSWIVKRVTALMPATVITIECVPDCSAGIKILVRTTPSGSVAGVGD